MRAQEATVTAIFQTVHRDFSHGILRTSGRLPPEILLPIFHATRPPVHQCDPSVAAGTNTPWLEGLRTRITLTLVCKAWLGPARDVLYEDIVFRRMGQIPALARTLRSPLLGTAEADVGNLIHSIRIDTCVIWAPFAQAITAELHYILSKCPALASLSYHPHPNLPIRKDVPRRDAELFDAFHPIPTVDSSGRIMVGGCVTETLLHGSLRELDLGSLDLTTSTLKDLSHMFEGGTRLSRLTLGPLKGRMEGKAEATFPLLEELSIHVDTIDGGNTFGDHIADRWRMPRLRALTILDCNRYPRRLVSRHGAHLRFLQLLGFPRSDIEDFDGSTLIKDCPAVEHLAIPCECVGYSTTPLVSPTLRHLDLWRTAEGMLSFLRGWADAEHDLWDPSLHTGLLAKYYLDTEECDLPACASVRFLMYPGFADGIGTRATSHRKLAHLPRTCHPTSVSGRGVRVWSFPQMRFVQTAWGVFPEVPAGSGELVRFDIPSQGGVADVEFVADAPPERTAARDEDERYVSSDSDTDSDVSDVDDGWSEDAMSVFDVEQVNLATMLEMHSASAATASTFFYPPSTYAGSCDEVPMDTEAITGGPS